jgi:hypothetical protein
VLVPEAAVGREELVSLEAEALASAVGSCSDELVRLLEDVAHRGVIG